MLLVVTVNSNYAVTVGLCAMGMDHDDECCCAHSTAGKENTGCKEISFTKTDCCTEKTTEFTNNADISFQKKIEQESKILLFIIDPVDLSSLRTTSNPIINSTKEYLKEPPDIPILHSSLLI